MQFYRSHAPALIVIHKSLKTRHPGRDCRDPEAMDGNTETGSKYAIGNCSIKSTVHIPVLWHCSCIALPPASLQSWIPAIPAGMTVYRRHLCITMSARAWERSFRRSASSCKTMCATATLDLIGFSHPRAVPGESSGTRRGIRD